MKEALKLALEAFEKLNSTNGYWWQEVDEETLAKIDPAITAIKAALAQPEQPKVRTGDCLLVGVCASEGHKIQVKQEPWRESASDYERGVIDGRQMQAQSSVDKAVNRMAQEQEPWCMKMNGCETKCEDCPIEVVQQEPVAKYSDIVSDGGLDPRNKFDASPQRTWVGLDEKDFSAINQSCLTKLQAATSAESILKEKNT